MVCWVLGARKCSLFPRLAHSNVWASFWRLKRLHTAGESFENKHEFGWKAFPRKLSKWQGSTLRKSWVFEPLAKIRRFRIILFPGCLLFLSFSLFFKTLPPSNPLLRQTCCCSPFRSVPAWYAEFSGLEKLSFPLGRSFEGLGICLKAKKTPYRVGKLWKQARIRKKSFPTKTLKMAREYP